jgi:hypothetical protein
LRLDSRFILNGNLTKMDGVILIGAIFVLLLLLDKVGNKNWLDPKAKMSEEVRRALQIKDFSKRQAELKRILKR